MVDQEKLAGKPPNTSFEQAAASVGSAITALQALRDHGKVQEEQKVLVVGASGGVGTFAVDRIRACEPTDERFAMPEGFDAKDYMASSFGDFQGPPVTVRIRFAPSAAVYVRERTWHPSQRLSPEPDGSLLFEVDVADSDEIRSWVLGWGPNAEVLAPDGLRGAVRDAARATARRYRPDDGEKGAG